jgi:hypothetical protein
MTYPGRSPYLSGGTGLPAWRQDGMDAEKSAEAIVVSGDADEGPNLLLQGAGGTTR